VTNTVVDHGTPAPSALGPPRADGVAEVDRRRRPKGPGAPWEYRGAMGVSDHHPANPWGPSGRWGRQGRLGTEGPPWCDGASLVPWTSKRGKGSVGTRGLVAEPTQWAVRDPLIAFRVATSQAQAEATKATPRSLRLAGAPARSLLGRLNASSGPRPHNRGRPYRPRSARPSFP
jgi:hypothetical protein